MQENKIKVAIYCLSVSKDAGIDTQIARLKGLCRMQEYEIYKIYVDNGYYNWDDERPARKLLLEDLKKDKFNLILETTLFKIEASSLKLKEIFKLLVQHNCNLIALKDNYNFNREQEKMKKERGLKNE